MYEAIVLSATTSREYDSLAIVFCAELGKVRVLARGIKKPGAKNTALFGAGAHVSCGLVPIKEGYLLTSVHTRSFFPSIHQQVAANLAYQSSLHLLERVLPFDQKEEEMFRIFEAWTQWMSDMATKEGFIDPLVILDVLVIFLLPPLGVGLPAGLRTHIEQGASFDDLAGLVKENGESWHSLLYLHLREHMGERIFDWINVKNMLK